MSPSKKEELTHEYYYGENAQEYAKSNWMARNQIKTSERILQLLEDPRIGGELQLNPDSQLILDLGCGSGFSSVIFEDNKFNIVGIDLSFDMLLENLEQQKIIEENEQIINIPRSLICAAIQHLPIRPHIFDHIISISAFNFILDNIKDKKESKQILNRVVASLASILKDKGRIVIEFYPKESEIQLYLECFSGQFDGGLVIDNPKGRKEQKFLILRKK